MSVERQTRWKRWHELWAELEQAEAFPVRSRLQLFGLSFRTLEGNYRELMASLEAMRSQPIPDDLGTPVGSDWIMPLFEIICRHGLPVANGPKTTLRAARPRTRLLNNGQGR
jgi:hypothetical protein